MSTTTTRRTVIGSRALGAGAAVLLAAGALAGCSQGAPEDGSTGATEPATAAVSDGGGSAEDGGTSGSASPQESTSGAGSSGDADGTASSGSGGDAAAGTFLDTPSTVAEGSLAETGGFDILTEPVDDDLAELSVTPEDGFQIEDSAGNGYDVTCEQPLVEGTDPVPCTFTGQDGKALQGEAVRVSVLAGVKDLVITRVDGSQGEAPPLVGLGSEAIFAGYYGTEAAGPDAVTADGLGEQMVQAYGLGMDPETPIADTVTARCKLRDGGLKATCELSGVADRVAGEYRAVYHRAGDGRPFYVFTPSDPA